MIFDPIFIFLTIDFCENLQEYFFVQNRLLIIKNDKNLQLLKYKCSLHAHLFDVSYLTKPNLDLLKKFTKLLSNWEESPKKISAKFLKLGGPATP